MIDSVLKDFMKLCKTSGDVDTATSLCQTQIIRIIAHEHH